jgi:hypothetical protein
LREAGANPVVAINRQLLSINQEAVDVSLRVLVFTEVQVQQGNQSFLRWY